MWELPQNILGLILLIFYRSGSVIEKYNGRFLIFNNKFVGGLSLGYFIYCQTKNNNLVSHEYGHTYQSRVLGPLYLMLIGLPSIIWCKFIYPKLNVDYDYFFIEGMATKLGNKYYKKEKL